MFTRSALFIGKLDEGREAEFFGIVEAELMPIWRRMPNALAVRLYRPRRMEAELPDLVLVQEVDYPSLDAVSEAEASPIRAEGAAVVEKLRAMFHGELKHVVYERLA